MIKSGAFLTTWSNRRVWLLGAVLLTVSTVASVAENASQSEPSAEVTETAGVRAPAVDASDEAAAPVPRTPPRAYGKPGIEAAKSLPDDDYYSKRAKSLLTEDAADAAKQLSLQAAYPGHNVVVCEAGCYGSAKRIVQFAPRVATKIETTGKLEPTAAAMPVKAVADENREQAQPIQASAPVPSGDISCVAGCYGAVKSYRSASQSAVLLSARAEATAIMREQTAAMDRHALSPRGASGADANRWMTTSTKANDEASRSANGQASPANRPPPKAAKEKRRTAKAKVFRMRAKPSGEWFEQINADRASRIR